MNKEDLHTVIATAPPVAVSGLTLFGVDMPTIVLILTAIYTILQIFISFRDKVYHPWKEKRDAKRAEANKDFYSIDDDEPPTSPPIG